MIKIKELSKDELLSIIYHNLPKTHYNEHPVFCASCAEGYEDESVVSQGEVVVPLGYICDKCEMS